jgi:hypothetical protein
MSPLPVITLRREKILDGVEQLLLAKDIDRRAATFIVIPTPDNYRSAIGQMVASGHHRGKRIWRANLRTGGIAVAEETKMPELSVALAFMNILFSPSHIADGIRFGSAPSLNRAYGVARWCCYFLLVSPAFQASLASRDQAPLLELYGERVTAILLVLATYPFLALASKLRRGGTWLTPLNFLHIASYILVFHVIDAAIAVGIASLAPDLTRLQEMISAVLMIWSMLTLVYLTHRSTNASYGALLLAVLPLLGLALYALAVASSQPH